MQTLDCADPSESVAKRNTTLTSLQALAMLNNPFMIAMSEQLAARAESRHDDAAQQIQFIFQQTLGRDPKPDEVLSLTKLKEQLGLKYVCRVVFNLNEFVFVD